MSVLNVVVGVFAAVLFVGGNVWWYLAGVLGFILNAVLDGCDGEVARYRKQSSLTGLFADRINSIFVFPLTLFGTSVGLYREFDAPWVMFVGFVAAWGFNALRLVKTSVDTTLIDALTLSKARREDHGASSLEEYRPLSEFLRDKRRWYLTVVDFILVRQPGFAIVYMASVAGEFVVRFVVDEPTVVMSPLLYVVAGYGLLNGAAVPAVVYVVITRRRVERSYDHLTEHVLKQPGADEAE